jgi:hypothetical protein
VEERWRETAEIEIDGRRRYGCWWWQVIEVEEKVVVAGDGGGGGGSDGSRKFCRWGLENSVFSFLTNNPYHISDASYISLR